MTKFSKNKSIIIEGSSQSLAKWVLTLAAIGFCMSFSLPADAAALFGGGTRHVDSQYDSDRGFTPANYRGDRRSRSTESALAGAFGTSRNGGQIQSVSFSGSLQMPLCECRGCRRSSSYGMRTHPIYGDRRFHAGVDYAAPTGTPVYASADGVIAYAGMCGSMTSGYGKFIAIDHGARPSRSGVVMASARRGSYGTCSRAVSSGTSTNYGHLSRIVVNAGQRVRAGQLIGYVGSTGGSTGPHLHYEVRVNGRPTNPESSSGISRTYLASSCPQPGNERTRPRILEAKNKWENNSTTFL